MERVTLVVSRAQQGGVSTALGWSLGAYDIISAFTCLSLCTIQSNNEIVLWHRGYDKSRSKTPPVCISLSLKTGKSPSAVYSTFAALGALCSCGLVVMN